jgi:hypothetical protein
MVKVPDANVPAQLPVTPAGNPVTVAPVALVVEKVMSVSGVLIHLVGFLMPDTTVGTIVPSAVTVIVPVVVTVPHPPVKVTA